MVRLADEMSKVQQAIKQTDIRSITFMCFPLSERFIRYDAGTLFAPERKERPDCSWV
jgi:hypothetical protein